MVDQLRRGEGHSFEKWALYQADWDQGNKGSSPAQGNEAVGYIQGQINNRSENFPSSHEQLNQTYSDQIGEISRVEFNFQESQNDLRFIVGLVEEYKSFVSEKEINKDETKFKINKESLQGLIKYINEKLKPQNEKDYSIDDIKGFYSYKTFKKSAKNLYKQFKTKQKSFDNPQNLVKDFINNRNGILGLASDNFAKNPARAIIMGFVDNYEGSLALSNGLKEALNKVLPKEKQL